MVPKLIVTAALMVAQMALTASRKIKGPRLDELNVSVADYGTPMPRFWGIRRFQASIIFAEKLRETKKTSKTKAGKYTQYKYHGTWASLIADNPIDAVTRIWFDKHLVYQTVSAGPTSIQAALGALFGQDTQVVHLRPGKNMRIYLGTETQNPDRRMVEWCEDRYGADSCPAYRGVSYIVFEDIPLEKLGNHIPQVTIEAVSSKTPAYPADTKTTSHFVGSKFAIGSQWLVHFFSNGDLQWWDLASRTYIGSSSTGLATSTVRSVALSSAGTAYFMGATLSGGSPRYLITCSPLGVPEWTLSDATSFQFEVTRVLETETDASVLTSYAGSTGYVDGYTHVAHAYSARDFCLNGDGDRCVLFQPTGASSLFTIENIDANTSISFSGNARSDVTHARFRWVDSIEKWFVHGGDTQFYVIDPADGSVDDSGASGWTDPPYLPQDGTDTFWDDFNEYSAVDGSLVRTVSKANFGFVSNAETVYDPLNNAIWARLNSPTNTIKIAYLDRIGSDGVTLQTIVDDVSGWCGLTGQDTSELTQLIDGYSVTQGSGKDMIGPLLDIHDVDARPHDFSVQFVNRGSAPSGSTILTENFVRGEGDRYTVTVQQDTDLPRKVTFNFADVDHDQQTNTAIAQRPLDAVDSQREETIDLSTYAADVDTAQRLAERYFRRVWNSRERPKLALTAQYLGLEPADVKTISLDGVVRNVRLDKMTIRQSVIDCEWVRDETAFAVLNNSTGAPMDGRDPEEIFIPAQVQGFILDTPLLTDSDNDVNPQLYYAAGGMTGTFPGAGVYRGDDGSYDDIFAVLESDQGATWGIAQSALGDANANLWDRGNSVDVNVFGTLTSVTEAEIDADPTLNMIALAATINGIEKWELLNFTTATLTGTNGLANTYTISGFKRGRRGTEWAVAYHAAGDRMLLLSGAFHSTLGSDDIGDDLSFKIQAIGRDPEIAPANDLTFLARSLKPYSPARVDWYYDGTDLQGTIYRRTRVGGNWNGGSTIPLSENSEAYEIDVLDGSLNVVRTIEVTGTNTFTYSASDMTTDFGVTFSHPPFYHAFQMSDATGRGFALSHVS